MSTRKDWNHTPEDMPIRVSPLWRRPLVLRDVLAWYAGAWLPWTSNVAILLLAILAYTYASPTLAEAATPGLWIGVIWLRNLALAFCVAHGLHLVFHGRGWQGPDHKYDPRPYPRRGRMFTLDDQLKDNMLWTLASGVTLWTLYEALIWWAMANGYAPVTSWSQSPVWFVAVFFLIPIWESFYFYWIHRLLHWGPFYRFHALHHRNTDVGPWSGLSMHPVEHVLYFGTALIHFVVPTHPLHLVTHLMFYALYAITTHTGFEGFWAGGRKRLHLGNFHHQLHHRYFEVNYGTLEVPWDMWFGTFDDGTPEARARLRGRKRQAG
ncbi:sterol desaturase family protein [Pseudaestuariivita atlantica]|uniref:Desaturase n=1 Tax=Pseudaestuariivita atlantica TaxID=1317121 RepID=A0A0L1JPA6_9RHOB|nr:sterol desaturase family protein [Pseudaestuariivita atlantica]KNG93556.1 desaturase [Pseudaestuariivita atlantica]